jgi:hypothetical protein
MSEKLTQNEDVAVLAQEDAFHMHQAAMLLQQLDVDGQSIELANDERLEIAHISVGEGGLAAVLRQRHTTRVDSKSREDVYFGFRPGQAEAAPHRALSIVIDDLAFEKEWIENGEFEKIIPRRNALIKKVAEGRALETMSASHDQVREFLRILHGAISYQHQLRSA